MMKLHHPILLKPRKMVLPESMRLDKWLWAARFFKTRKLATEAIQGGKVHLDGQRSKPGKTIHPGSKLEINKNSLTWNVEVLVLPKQRRPASEAITFYSESTQSQEDRAALASELRIIRAANTIKTEGRPSKRDRRLIHKFKEQR